MSAEWFDDPAMRDSYREFIKSSVKQQEVKIDKTQEILRESFYRLAYLNGNEPYIFNSEGKDKEAIMDALETTYCAFSKTFKSGKDIGRTVLCFTEDSILRFLKGTSMSKDLLDAFIDYCKEKGVWREQNKIRTGKSDPEDYKVFYVDELMKYGSEDDR